MVIVQWFLEDNELLLLPSQMMALEASVQATTIAMSKLQMLFSIAEVVSIVESDKVGSSERDIVGSWFQRFTTYVTDDKTWRENFRMSKLTFDHVLESLRPALQRHQDEDEPGDPSVPVDFMFRSQFRSQETRNFTTQAFDR